MIYKNVFFGVLILVVAMFFCDSVFAANTTIVPVHYNVTVDFQGERDFFLEMPNGYSRHFFWNSGEIHSDVTFTHIIYPDIDYDYVCEDTDQLEQYENINDGLMDVLVVCGDVISKVNESTSLMIRLNEAIRDREEYERIWRICEESRKELRNDTEELEQERDTAESGLSICQSSLATARRTSDDYNECKTELNSCNGSKGTWPIFAGIGGFGAAWFIWGRKKRRGPSEQAEAGYAGDDVRDPYEGYKRRLKNPPDHPGN